MNKFGKVVIEGTLSKETGGTSISSYQLELCKRFSESINQKSLEVTDENEEMFRLDCEYYSVEDLVSRKI